MNKPKYIRIWVLPRRATWDEARTLAQGLGARLLYPTEAEAWSDMENLDLDFWMANENTHADD